MTGFEAETGLRYYFWTDKFRPFFQAGVSYLYLKHFYDQVSGAVEKTYLSHPHIFSIHVQPGVEFKINRDIAAKVGVDIQRWILMNTGDSTMFTVSAGVIFYS